MVVELPIFATKSGSVAKLNTDVKSCWRMYVKLTLVDVVVSVGKGVLPLKELCCICMSKSIEAPLTKSLPSRSKLNLALGLLIQPSIEYCASA